MRRLTCILILLLCAPIGWTKEKPKDKKSTKSEAKVATPPKAKPKKEPEAPKDPTVGVKKFEFVGIKRTPQDMLRKISSKYIKYSAFGDWTKDMVAEIQRIPIVRDVHLMRDMTGNITIEIKEREPIAYLLLDRYYWMDEQGRIIQEVPNNNLENKVFFSGPWKSAAEFEKKTGWQIVNEGVRFYSMLLSQQFPEKNISEIHFDAKLGWIMYRMGSRAPVIFGTQDLPQKVERFLQVVPQFGPYEDTILSLDADFNDRVIVKLKKESA